MPEYNIFDLGFDKNLQRGVQENVIPSTSLSGSATGGGGGIGGGLDGGYGGGLSDMTNDMVNPQDVVSGNISGEILMGDATAPLTGVGIFLGLDDTDGKYEARFGDPDNDFFHWDGTNISITGTITATAGVIGGWTISSTELSNGSVKLQSTAERILLGAATEPTTGVGVFIGKDGADYEFRAGDPAGDNIHWDGTNLNINGNTLDATILQIATVTVSASAAELNILDGFTGSTANLNTLTDGSDAFGLHSHLPKFGTASVTGATGTGSFNITHGLGGTPTFFELHIFTATGANNGDLARVMGYYDGTTASSINWSNSSGNATVRSDMGALQDSGSANFLAFTVTTFDTTTITVTYTETGAITLDFVYQWKAF